MQNNNYYHFSQKLPILECEDSYFLDAIDWKWDSQKGRFVGSCDYSKVEKAIAIYQYGLQTIEWSVVGGDAVTIYRSQYKLKENAQCHFELIEVKTISRGDDPHE